MRAKLLLVGCMAASFSGACRQDMHDQPKYEAMEASPFFTDGRSMRPLVEGTVARGRLFEDTHFFAGMVDGVPAETFPFEVTASVLERGRERYGIFCAPCHDGAGHGEGMIVKRGMKHPPSLHIERLRAAPPGYFYDVITRGFGAMYDLADRVPPRDRWAIVAYVRALQLSQNATIDDATPEARAALEASQ
jgi:hypothetical protein